MPASATAANKIRLRFWDENENPTIVKTFTGRWIVGDEQEGVRAHDDSARWDAGAEWSVAQSTGGKLVVYVQHCNDGFAPLMEVYDSFDELRDDTDQHGGRAIPQNVVAATAGALGIEYEYEIDIDDELGGDDDAL